jgi:hypothetical protein
MADRMFHVLVLGGFALVGCGGSTGAKVTAAANGAADTADGASGGDDASGGSVPDALIDAAADGWIPIEGPQPLPEAAAADGSAGALADASTDGYVEPCSHLICCTVNCCTPIVCEGPQ